MTRPGISGISPFFIVADVAAALSFYRDMLGFEVTFPEPAHDAFFAIVCRDAAMIMVKAVGVEPLPNCARQAEARWDAYLNVPRSRCVGRRACCARCHLLRASEGYR